MSGKNVDPLLLDDQLNLLEWCEVPMCVFANMGDFEQWIIFLKGMGELFGFYPIQFACEQNWYGETIEND